MFRLSNLFTSLGEKPMAFTVITPTTSPDRTPVGSYGAVIPGTPDSVVSFPTSSGTISLGLSQIAAGIINLYPGSGSASSGSVSVPGLTATDVVITSFDSDASGSSQFFTKFLHGTDTIVAYGYALTGSSYAECHYVVFRP
jgi:hypothetical protein